MIRLFRRLSALAYVIGLIAVTALSLLPQAQMPGPEGTDKLAHLLAYGLIAFTAGFGFTERRDRLYAGVFALALGLALEVAQGFVPNRQPSAADALANSVGVVLGLAFASVIQRLAGLNTRETDTIGAQIERERLSGRHP